MRPTGRLGSSDNPSDGGRDVRELVPIERCQFARNFSGLLSPLWSKNGSSEGAAEVGNRRNVMVAASSSELRHTTHNEGEGCKSTDTEASLMMQLTSDEWRLSESLRFQPDSLMQLDLRSMNFISSP